MKYIIFVILLICFCRVSYAQFTQFDFSLKSYLVDNEKEIEVEFNYLLTGYKEGDFSVRPVVENGIVEIFNEDSGQWVSSFSSFSNFPKLSKKNLITFKGLTVEKSVLHFEIYEIGTGKTYLTPKKSIWSEKVYEKYIEKVNESLSRKNLEKKEVVEEVAESSQSSGSEKYEPSDISKFIDSIPKKYFLFFGVAVFVISAVVGFKYKKFDFRKGFS